MNKCVILLFLSASASVTSVTSVHAAEFLVIKDVFVEDVVGGGGLYVNREVIDNGDNTYTVVPGKRSAELKLMHQKVCLSVALKPGSYPTYLSASIPGLGVAGSGTITVR